MIESNSLSCTHSIHYGGPCPCPHPVGYAVTVSAANVVVTPASVVVTVTYIVVASVFIGTIVMPATLLGVRSVVVVGTGGGSGDSVVPTGGALVDVGAPVGLKENVTVREGVVWIGSAVAAELLALFEGVG